MSVAFCSLPSALAGGAWQRAGMGPRAPASARRNGSIPNQFANPRAGPWSPVPPRPLQQAVLADLGRTVARGGWVMGLMRVLAE